MRKQLKQGDRKRIVWLDMQRIPQKTIADRLGTVPSVVSRWLKVMKENGEYQSFKEELQSKNPVTFGDSDEPEPKMKNTGENPEFAAAVKEMIEERTVQETLTEDKLPPAVWRALMSRLSDIDEECLQREQRISELKQEIRELEKERNTIEEWRAKHA